jgi:hypothetical protein
MVVAGEVPETTTSLELNAGVAYCPINKDQVCTLPAVADIRPDGRCEKAVEFDPATKPKKRMVVDGD